MTCVDRSSWGPASSFVGQSLAVPVAALGIFATGYYIGYVASNAFGGFLTDWLGGRMLLSVTGVLAGLVMFAFGSVESTTTGLVVQGLLGLFAGADFAAGLKLISTWFRPAQRGLAIGIFMTATSLGTVIANAVVPRIIAESSWRDSYHMFGIITIIISVLTFSLVRNEPQDVERADHSGSESRSLPNLRPLFTNRDLLLLGLAGFGGVWGATGFITWSNTLMVRGNGIDPVDAGIVLVMFSIIAIGIKPIVGWVTDALRLGQKIPIIFIFIVFGCALLLFGRLSTFTQFLWCAPLVGFGAYAFSPLTAALAPVLSGKTLAGSAAGGVNAVWQLGSVAAPALVGAVYQATDSFYSAFVILAIGPFVGALMACFIRAPRPGKSAGDRDAAETTIVGA
ncbi:MFS transporter [Arthrobacter sp. StoSoilB22]|uniref:MFS transporter n=1 Tax=Arthrobacter sp. StoSoilB22 TaxID=2830996 RepID=UPI001CC59D70|nr:MFS transporter [Arthrobacter sp. StoSoilB22]